MSILRPVTERPYERVPAVGIRVLLTVQLTWMILVAVLLSVLGGFVFEQFYVLSYLGLVVVAQLFAPVADSPRWWTTVQWLIRLGFLGLCYFVAMRFTDVIGA